MTATSPRLVTHDKSIAVQDRQLRGRGGGGGDGGDEVIADTMTSCLRHSIINMVLSGHFLRSYPVNYNLAAPQLPHGGRIAPDTDRSSAPARIITPLRYCELTTDAS